MYKILEVSSDTNIGGAGKCLLTLLSNFDRSRFEVKTVLPKGSLLKPHIEALNIPVIEAEGIADKSLDRGAIGEMKKIIKREKPDLVHTHASMSARIAAKMAGTKIVYTRHSVFPPSKKISRGIGKWVNGAVNNFLSDEIIAVAEAAKENLTDTGVSKKKIHVILNGVEGLTKVDEAQKQRIRERFSVDENDKVISIIARLEDIKGHTYFIDAAYELIKAGVKGKFIIAGTGSYENVLKQKVHDKGLEKDILFTGFINDVDQLLNITDIQVNASYGTEATSLALLEGMSIGVPAVVSDFGGNPGVIQDGVNGFVVKKQDTKALYDGILKLLTDDVLFEKMKKGAETIFQENFTAQAMTRNTENLYERTIKGRK